jgi:3-oxoacyl-[acyl-carrier protein] reductase
VQKPPPKELAHLGVRLNAIQPGLIRTAMTEAMPQKVSSYTTGTVLEVTGRRFM